MLSITPVTSEAIVANFQGNNVPVSPIDDSIGDFTTDTISTSNGGTESKVTMSTEAVF